MTSTHASQTAKTLAKVSFCNGSQIHWSFSHLLHFAGRNGRGRLRGRRVLQKEQEGHDWEQPEDGKGLKKWSKVKGGLPNQASPVFCTRHCLTIYKTANLKEPRPIERWNGRRLPESKIPCFLTASPTEHKPALYEYPLLSWMHNIRLMTISMMQINATYIFR